MLEPCVNQAAGLQGLALQAAPRLVGVASHGLQKGELPVLWGLCASWVDMGLSVMVLDGHAQESPKNPGLDQLLANPLSRFADDELAPTWSVIPAANGLQQLSACGFLASPVAGLFKNYTIVLVYAAAQRMTQLLKGSGLTPLLIVPPGSSAALSAYKALKQLLLEAQLRPTVANIVPESAAKLPAQSVIPAENVMECVTNFLGYTIKPLTITASAQAERSQADINRLALQLLENALLLERYPTVRVH